MTPEARRLRRKENEKRYRLKHADERKAYHRSRVDEKREYDKWYQVVHVDHLKKLRSEYTRAHKEQKREYDKKYRVKNAQKILLAHRRARLDPVKKIKFNLRTRISMVIRGKIKNGHTIKSLGCSLPALLSHLMSKFQSGMTWENYGRKGWHIDHIKPLAAFDLTDHEQYLQACHYTNLQPLWWYDNLKKSDNYAKI
jgi:hypothetical protein